MNATEARAATLQRLIDRLEAGELPPWRKPWSQAMGAAHLYPRNGLTGRLYTGYNRVRLMLESRADARWYTWRQVGQMGDRVKRGEHLTGIEYWSQTTARPTDDSADDTPATTADHRPRTRWFCKSYSVVCADQLEGWTPPTLAPFIQPPPIPDELSGWLDAITDRGGLRVQYGHAHAAYSPSLDAIRMPAPIAFESIPAYYSTLIHEACHWTGHQARLARIGITDVDRTAPGRYAVEELIAEIGSAYTEAGLGLAPSDHDQRATYVASWLRDAGPNALAIAAAAADKAASYLLAYAPEPIEDAEELREAVTA